MSMIMSLKQAPAPTLDLLIERPELAVVFWMDPKHSQPKQPGWLVWIAKLLGHYRPPLDLPEAPTDLARNGETLDLDKSWHGLQWLLTRHLGLADDDEWQAPLPEGTLLAGGEPIDGSDHGYGDDRAVPNSQIAAFDAFLQSTPWESLDERYDGEAMNAAGIYPTNWTEPLERDELAAAYLRLKQFIHDTSEQTLGAVIQLS